MNGSVHQVFFLGGPYGRWAQPLAGQDHPRDASRHKWRNLTTNTPQNTLQNHWQIDSTSPPQEKGKSLQYFMYILASCLPLWPSTPSPHPLFSTARLVDFKRGRRVLKMSKRYKPQLPLPAALKGTGLHWRFLHLIIPAESTKATWASCESDPETVHRPVSRTFYIWECVSLRI